ncbi:MAG: phosphate signaling complex protein PhoU [Burkholderiales bacterium]|nr:phosphate signaling complex protein PhoU [Burkholderiales bacterium]
MTDRHISSLFDAELSALSTRVLEMGGLVEAQVVRSVQALREFSGEAATEVLESERRVNGMEVEIDHDLSSIIARHQPTACDLRLLISVSKAVADLERVGDESARIARTVHRQLHMGMSTHLRHPLADLGIAADMAIEALKSALDAFARRDANVALKVIEGDKDIDREFEGLARLLMTYMVEDPRAISSCIDLIFVAKAIERVGDHAKNLAKLVIYMVKGQDVRHRALNHIQGVV